jgi:hypothetical protein
MPGPGLANVRPWTEAERDRLQSLAEMLNLSLEQVLSILGETCLDVHLNGSSFGPLSRSTSGNTGSAAIRFSRSGSATANTHCWNVPSTPKKLNTSRTSYVVSSLSSC